MPVAPRRCVTVALLLASVTAGCEARGVCEAAQPLFSCGAQQSEEQFDAAVDGCVDTHKDAKKRGGTCADAHLAFLSCMEEEGDCNTIGSWRDDKCGVDESTLCAAEAANFCELCPGLWFAPD